MRKINLICFICFLFVFGTGSGRAWAGVYYETEIRSNLDSAVHIEKTFISGTRMKTLVDDSHGWLVDLKAGKLWDYDLEAGTYYEISLNDMGKELDAVKSQIEVMTELYHSDDEMKRLKALDAEEPDFEKTLLGKTPDKPFVPVLKKVKKKKKFLEYECSLYQVDLSDTHQQEIWVTSQIPFREEVTHFWNAFYRYAGTPLTQFPELKHHFELMSRLEGFILFRKTQIRSGSVFSYEEEETVLRLEEKNFSMEIFELPKNLKKVSGQTIQRKDSLHE